MSMHIAFGISEEDVEAVLEANAARIVSAVGRTLEDLSWTYFPSLDLGLVERCALAHDVDMEAQTEAAHVEIARQLETLGALRPVVA